MTKINNLLITFDLLLLFVLDVLLAISLLGRFSFEQTEPDEGVGDMVVVVDDEEFEFVDLLPFDVLFALSKC